MTDMTGFTKWLAKVFCVGSKEDLWRERDKSKLSLLLPSRFKVHIRNERVLGECFTCLDAARWHSQRAPLMAGCLACPCMGHPAHECIIHQRLSRRAEYKIQYLVSPGVATQQYDVRLYLFFTTELDAAETSFFSSLYECVRLHIPRVRCPSSVLK